MSAKMNSTAGTVEALESDYLRNSKKWSYLEPVAHKNELSLAAAW